jgi:hypothetical protein
MLMIQFIQGQFSYAFWFQFDLENPCENLLMEIIVLCDQIVMLIKKKLLWPHCCY